MIVAAAANPSYLVFRRDLKPLSVYTTDEVFQPKNFTTHKIAGSLEKVELT